MTDFKSRSSKSRSDSLDYDNMAMDNSVLGAQTMASLEGRLKQASNPLNVNPIPFNDSRLNPYSFRDSDTDTEAGRRPTNMAYVGESDDISTIANDTMAAESQSASITKLFSSISIRNKDPRTPERRNKPGREDGETAPEIFRVMVQGPVDKDTEVEENSSFSKVKYYWATFLAIFLIGAIAALAYGLNGLKNLRGQNAGPAQISDTTDQEEVLEWDWTFKPSQQESPPPTMTAYPTSALPTPLPTRAPTLLPSRTPSSLPSMVPSTPMPSSDPTTLSPSVTPSSTPTLSQSPTPVPSAAPTGTPTRTPTPAPTFTKEENFTLIMTQISASILDDIATTGTAQRRAMQWITDDPDYFSYSEDRIIQRWALAVFSLEVSTSRRNRRLNGALEDWMEYNDECDWFISSNNGAGACDDAGVFKYLVLRDVDLDGTIPSELFLLKKLHTLVLSNNNIEGTIPNEIRRMDKLKVLELNNNRLGGPIPDKIGDLKKLDVLDLGHNYLTGTIPKDIGKMKDAKIFSLIGNSLTGTIPVDVGKMKDLEILDLRNNQLNGTVPLEMMDLSRLQELELIQNDLSGRVPNEICASLQNLVVFSVDCSGTDPIECDCCTNCNNGVTPAPSASARPPTTPRPTPSPTAPVPPTSDPTPNPTPAPTQCQDKIEISKNCYERGEDIKVNFFTCDPIDSDWVGLYDSSENPYELGDPLLWLWSCGNQNCQEEIPRGAVYLDDESEGESKWPVKKGSYKVFMVRGASQGGAYRSFAESREIEIADKC